MISKLFCWLAFSFAFAAFSAEQPSKALAREANILARPNDSIVWPDSTNDVQFRLYTNAAPDSPRLFNTFELEAYGEILLPSPGGDRLQQWLVTSPADPLLHNIVVDGKGPALNSTNRITFIEEASAAEWRYIAFDLTAPYRDRLKEYRRAILYIQPDLFVLWDHLVAQKTINFQMLIHPPATTVVDAVWGDLRLEMPKAGFLIHAPAARRKLRNWERIESAADKILPGTQTMRLGPTNQFAELDLLTVFAVHRAGEKKDFAFRLLESQSAVGARIHRQGLPTLVAFKTDFAAPGASLTGFNFSGPVSVDVFRPKPTKASK